eukprot:252968-Prymnesium_polylepis.2
MCQCGARCGEPRAAKSRRPARSTADRATTAFGHASDVRRPARLGMSERAWGCVATPRRRVPPVRCRAESDVGGVHA